ncbi:MAG: 30S ribosomal protein S4e [Desulfurococcaceae archaeon]
MARMGGSRHLKRLAAPEFWPTSTKAYVWTVKPSPGPHPIESSMPLLILVRDVLKYAETGREARRLIAEGHFKVDGRVRKDYKFPVGPMDVLEVVDTREFYRVLPVPTKVLGLVKISEEEAKLKVCRINNKVTVKGGHIQLNLHDGRNILVRVSDPKNPAEDVYETYGGLLITIPDQKIVDYFPLREGAVAIVMGGRNVGRVGRITSVHRAMGPRRSIVTLEDNKGARFQTALTYILPLGNEKPSITLPEGAW